MWFVQPNAANNKRVGFPEQETLAVQVVQSRTILAYASWSMQPLPKLQGLLDETLREKKALSQLFLMSEYIPEWILNLSLMT